MTEPIKSLAELKEWGKLEIIQVRSKFGDSDKRWNAYIDGIKAVLEKIGELENYAKELQRDALRCIAKNVYSDSKLHVGFDCKDCSLDKAEICLNVSDVFRVILGDDKSG